MNKEQFKGNWDQIKGSIRKQYGKFTDDDVEQIKGDFEIFKGKLRETYGYTEEQAEKEANNLH